jgi:TatD DNase family protein
MTPTTTSLSQSLPAACPPQPASPLKYADVAVTATAAEFAGVYRGKQYHPSDVDAVLDRAREAGVQKILLTGMSLADVDYHRELVKTRMEHCSMTVGVHPYHVSEIEADEDHLDKLAAKIDELMQSPETPLKAYGELGLDYDRLDKAPKDVQVNAFRAQLELFVQRGWDLPLFLHCRAAFDDFVEIIEPYVPRLPRSGLVHSFVGTTVQMHKLVAMGFDISVNGFSFKDSDSLEMVSQIPLRRLQIETDAPWGEIKDNDEVWKRYGKNCLSKPSIRKKKDKWEAGHMVKERNESSCIERVAFVVAGLQGRTVDEVADAALRNSLTMFWEA